MKQTKHLHFHPPVEEWQKGYYTINQGSKWFAKRKARSKLQKQSRKANRS